MQTHEIGTQYKAKQPFVVMAKPVGPACNLRCGYCYYLEAENCGKDARALCMEEDLLEDFIRQYIEASPGPVVSFTWHGGEPTLAGLDFYERAVHLQKRYLPKGWECWNSLQTNGILLDDRWCEFLKENRFDVGLSLDGTKWLHDANRRDLGGQGSYERALQAVERLQRHGVQPDLLCTVTADTAREPLETYRALKGLGTGWMQFIPIVRRLPDGGVTLDSVTGEAYGQFLCAIFDEWLLNDMDKTQVQLFAETALVLSGGSASLCWMAPTCGRAVVVERDGAVYACDHFVQREYRIGDLQGSGLGALVDGEKQLRFGLDKRERLPEKCRACPHIALCNGGCPKDRFVQVREGQGALNYLCEGLERFFSHARQPLVEMMQLRKSGMHPQAIMAAMREKEALKWKNVGRNDPCPCGSGRKAKQCCWAKRP